MWMKKDRLIDWKVGTAQHQPVMYLTTEESGVIALKLTADLARDLGRALLFEVLGLERYANWLRKRA